MSRVILVCGPVVRVVSPCGLTGLRKVFFLHHTNWQKLERLSGVPGPGEAAGRRTLACLLLW